MRKKRQEFSQEEDRFLIENQESMTNREIGTILKRNENTIRGRKNILYKNGLIRSLKKWSSPLTNADINFIKDNSWNIGIKECAIKLNRSYWTVSAVIRRMKIPVNPDFKFRNRQDISNFKNPSDPFVVYFLGLFWADGTISKAPKHRVKLKISKNDFEDIREYTIRLGDFWNEANYKDSRHEHWSTMTVFEITHRELWHFFDAHDYFIKSVASADKILSHIPQHLRHYWWRGYFDGDGCFSGRRLSFNSGMNQDWAFIDLLGQYLNISFSIERRDRGSRAGSKAVLSRWHFIKKMIDYMYEGEQFGFKRKMNRCFDYLKKYNEPRKRGGNSSKYRGVSWSKHTKNYVMQITCGDKKATKRFSDEISAAKAYDLLASEWFGNKAILNFS